MGEGVGPMKRRNALHLYMLKDKDSTTDYSDFKENYKLKKSVLICAICGNPKNPW